MASALSAPSQLIKLAIALLTTIVMSPMSPSNFVIQEYARSPTKMTLVLLIQNLATLQHSFVNHRLVLEMANAGPCYAMLPVLPVPLAPPMLVVRQMEMLLCTATLKLECVS